MQCGSWSKFYMECDSGYCICSKNFADLDGNASNGCEKIKYGATMAPSQCGPVAPSPENEVQKVEAEVDFTVETGIPFTPSLLDKSSPEYTTAASEVGDLFVDNLNDVKDWDLTEVDVDFIDPSDSRRKRREDDEKFANAKITTKYQKQYEKDEEVKDMHVSSLERNVRYQARKSVILGNGKTVGKSQIYKDITFPTTKASEPTKEIADKEDMKEKPQPALKYKPPKPEDKPAEGDKPEGGKSEGEKPEGDKPDGDKPEGDKPEEEKPEGQKPEGDKPNDKKPESEKPDGDKPAEGDKPEDSIPPPPKDGNEPKDDGPPSPKEDGEGPPKSGSYPYWWTG